VSGEEEREKERHRETETEIRDGERGREPDSQIAAEGQKEVKRDVQIVHPVRSRL